jgi:hypothetical protein
VRSDHDLTCQTALERNNLEKCGRCGQPLTGRSAFTLGGERRHLHCALLYRPMIARSFRIALVVGTILTLINQGTLLLAGQFPGELFWKIPLTYCVPFCVATWGALSNNRISLSQSQASRT